MNGRRIAAEISAFLPHIVLCYSLMLLTFSVINYFNTAMEFLDSPISRRFEVLYTVLAFAELAVCVIRNRLRLFAVCALFLTAAFAVPVLVAFFQDSREPLLTVFFLVAAFLESLVMIVFSVMNIVRMRRSAAAET